MLRNRCQRQILERVAARPFSTQPALFSRPRLQFLSAPTTPSSSSSSPRRVRFLTTERAQWIKFEVYLGLRYTALLVGMSACAWVIYMSVLEERLERYHPTPAEWSFWSRAYLRGSVSELVSPTANGESNWVHVFLRTSKLIDRLEDPNIDGQGVRELLGNGEPLSIADAGRAGVDVSAKSENWRRAYYETMMLQARGAEHLDGFVRDRTTGMYCPENYVVSPTKPYPRVWRPEGAEPLPLEENCETACPPADGFYFRILTTRGFTAKQRMDAALACAAWYEYKGEPDAAARMNDWALALATEGTAPSDLPYDPKTLVLRDTTKPPSANVLTALTAVATHKARHDNPSSALPIFLSLLRARRSLPKDPPPGSAPPRQKPASIGSILANIFVSPSMGPAPDDGTHPPAYRDAAGRCREAALQLYVGEILYSLARSGDDAGREEALAWTRDAVDTAEEQLRGLPPLPDKWARTEREVDTRKACRECLAAGLENWFGMVERLARDEEARNQSTPKSSGLAFWSRGTTQREPAHRWAAEQKVVVERTRRTQELLDDLQPEPEGFLGYLKA